VLWLEPREGAVNCRFVRGVHDHELRVAHADAVHAAHDLGAEAAPAHPEQVDGRNAILADLIGQRLDTVEFRPHARGDVQPAQALRDGLGDVPGEIRGPDGDVAPPDASYNVLSQQGLCCEVGGFVRHGLSV